MGTREFQVVGPPGTGKTTYLSAKAKQAVEKRGAGSVTIASLTKAAAVEIAGRVDIPREQVGTLHSLCMHAAGLAGKMVLDSSKGFKAWNEWCGKKNAQWKLTGGSDPDDPMSGSKGEKTRGSEALERMMLLRHRMVPVEMWPPSVREFGYLWGDALEELQATDFTQMIEAGLEMEAPPGNPSVLLCDEVQDFSRLEGAVVRKWAQNVETAILVGDPDQCIYAWRGADPEIFSGNPVPAENHRILEQSYRVPVAVHALAQRIIQGIRHRTDAPYLPTAEQGKVTYREDCSWRRPEGWLDEVLAASQDGGAMVLASCAFLLQPLLSLLRREGLAYWNPMRLNRGDWNPLGSLGSGKKTAARQLLAYLGGGPDGWRIEDLQAWLPLLRSAKHKIPLLDDDAALKYGVKSAIARLEPSKGSPSHLTPHEYLALYQDPEDGVEATRREISWLLAKSTPEDRERLRFPAAIIRRAGIEALQTEPGISVGTIHSVKGGQARHVFVIGALPTQWAEEGGDSLARLFYVACTRAKESVTLISGDRGGFEF